MRDARNAGRSLWSDTIALGAGCHADVQIVPHERHGMGVVVKVRTPREGGGYTVKAPWRVDAVRRLDSELRRILHQCMKAGAPAPLVEAA